MTIQTKRAGAKITLEVEGRVDTTTAPQLQAEILNAFQSTRELVLDLKKVTYVSSAGLRALLLGQKTASSKGATMILLHVAESVMQILETVGFSSILTIR